MTLPLPNSRAYNNYVLFLLILWVRSLSRTQAGGFAAPRDVGWGHPLSVFSWPQLWAKRSRLLSLMLGTLGCSMWPLFLWCFIVQPELLYSWAVRLPSREKTEAASPFRSLRSEVPERHFCHSWWLGQLESLPRSLWGLG